MLNKVFAKELHAGPPKDWQQPANSPLDRLDAWKLWHDQRTDDIVRVLWPRFDFKILQWQGATADVNYMLELTRLDLELLLEIQRDRILEKKIESPVTPQKKTHHHLFSEEDEIGFNNTYHAYDPRMERRLLDQVERAFLNGLTSKVAGSHVQWKAKFQRPRPYQMATFLGYNDFTHEQAITSLSPSLVSGHSLQALLCGGAVIEHFLEKPPSPHTIDCLEQWLVDFGDRRVMARVHYPSDNLSSWIGGMYLAGRVYRSPDVKRHLWNAISTRSFVFKKIMSAVEKKRGDAYRPALDALFVAAQQEPSELKTFVKKV